MGFTYEDIFTIDEDNDPGNPEKDETSAFYLHKNQIIQEEIMKSLAQAIHTYNPDSGELPNLTGEEWEQILGNVSVVSFLQGIPIGFKTYNSYAIATSTNNREYVDPNEIYFLNNKDSDEYYHRCQCNKTIKRTDNMYSFTGYKSVDFVENKYITKDAGTGEENTKYYFLHNNGTEASMACYYCLVNRANLEETDDDKMNEAYTIAYDTALARERYRAKQDVTISKDKAVFKVKKYVSPTSGYTIDDTITWKIEISNVGTFPGKVIIFDSILEGQDYIGYSFNGTTESVEVNSDSLKIKTGMIDAGATCLLEVSVRVTKIGTLYNNVILKSEDGIDDIDGASAKVQAEKEVTISTGSTEGKKANVVLVLDESTSLRNSEKKEIREASKQFINKLKEGLDLNGDGDCEDPGEIPGIAEANIHVIAYAQNASEITDLDSYGGGLGSGSLKRRFTEATGFSTNYLGALMAAEGCLEQSVKASDDDTRQLYENYIIFMSDGGPTANQWPREENIEEIETKYKIVNLFVNFLIEAINWIKDAGEDLAALLIGSWYECLWVDEDSYWGNSLLTDFLYLDIAGINKMWNGIFENASDDYVEAVWQFNWEALEGTIFESEWTYSVIGIMPKVHDLKTLDSVKASAGDPEGSKDLTQSQIYTIFYEPRSIFQSTENIAERLESTEDNDNARFYGLQRMATGGVATEKDGTTKVHRGNDDYGYKEGRQYSFRCESIDNYEKQEEKIAEVFDQIAKDIQGTVAVPSPKETVNGILTLDKHQYPITDVMIGSNKLSEIDVNELNKINEDLLENEGKLDINEYTHLRTSEEITIIY